MNSHETIILSRQQLYEQVWSTPIIHLAKTYHLSDVGLAKVCRKHQIPYPPRGYWEKKRHGKEVPQTPLPFCSDPRLQSISFAKNPPPPAAPAVPVTEPVYDPEVVHLLEKVHAIEKVDVKTELRSLHPLIRSTYKGLHQADPDPHNLLTPRHDFTEPVVNVVIGEGSIQRAMLYLDALFRAFDKVGGTVEIDRSERPNQTRVRILGESPMQIRLRERYKQRRRPEEVPIGRWRVSKMEYLPTGRLILEGSTRGSYWRTLCEDTDESRVENHILDTIALWVQQVGRNRAERLEAEKNRRIQAERERVRREQEFELQRRRTALEAKQKVERDKLNSLLQEASNWEQSRVLREYLKVVEERAIAHFGKIEEDSDMFRWLQWARQQADRLDPLAPSPPSILDETIPD